MTSIISSRNWSILFDPRRITAVAPTPIPTRKVKNGSVESFLDIDISYSSFFHDPHFGSAFVFYLIGISGKQLDAVDWIDERLGSFSLAWREISLLDSPQLEHNPRRWSRSCPDSAGALSFAVPDLGFVTV